MSDITTTKSAAQEFFEIIGAPYDDASEEDIQAAKELISLFGDDAKVAANIDQDFF